MPVLRAVVVLELDGVPLPGFPSVRRISLSEGQAFDYVKATGGGATALPVGEIGVALSALIVRPDQQVTLALGQIVLKAGGLLLIVDADLGTGAQATITNASGSSAQVKGYGGGS